MAKANYKKKTTEQQKAEVVALTENMDKSIESYFHSPENLKEYLGFMAKFYQYSTGNVSLIQEQFRGAQAVGSFKFWKDKGYSVRKGEQGIKILTPNPVKGRFQDAEGNWRLLKEANEEEKGKIEKRQLKHYPDHMRYSIGYVYDISQTTAPASDLPKVFPNKWLDGKVENYEVFQRGLQNVADHIGVKIMPNQHELGASKGAFYPFENTIELNHRNSELQNVTTLIHELAHAKLHSKERMFDKERHEEEFQAEMVSYAVSAYFNLGEEKEEKSLHYLYSWTKDRTLDDKEQLLKEVRETSVEFISLIEEELVKAKEKAVEHTNNYSIEKVYLVRYEGIESSSIEEMSKDQFINWSTTNEFASELFKDKPDLLIKRFNAKNKEKFFAIGEKDWPTTHDNEKRPLMLIKWSEHDRLSSNSVMPFGEANDLISKLEKEVQLGKEAGEEILSYYKTRYNVLVPIQENQISIINPQRYDIGDYFYSGPMDQIVRNQEQYNIQYLTDEERTVLLDEIVYHKGESKVDIKEDSFEILSDIQEKVGRKIVENVGLNLEPHWEEYEIQLSEDARTVEEIYPRMRLSLGDMHTIVAKYGTKEESKAINAISDYLEPFYEADLIEEELMDMSMAKVSTDRQQNMVIECVSDYVKDSDLNFDFRNAVEHTVNAINSSIKEAHKEITKEHDQERKVIHMSQQGPER